MLGFHAALLQPAVETGRPIQPVALSYQGNNGLRSVAPAYAGATTLMGSLHAILKRKGLRRELSPCRRCPCRVPSAGVGANGESESQRRSAFEDVHSAARAGPVKHLPRTHEIARIEWFRFVVEVGCGILVIENQIVPASGPPCRH